MKLAGKKGSYYQAHGNSHEEPPQEYGHNCLMNGQMGEFIQSSEHASRHHEHTEQTCFH